MGGRQNRVHPGTSRITEGGGGAAYSPAFQRRFQESLVAGTDFPAVSPCGGNNGHDTDRIMFVDVIQHHHRVIHGPERGNKAAVGQQGFLDPKRLHAAGHQIHPDTPGDCAGHIPDQLVECPQILGWQGNGDHTVPEVTGLYQAAVCFRLCGE